MSKIRDGNSQNSNYIIKNDVTNEDWDSFVYQHPNGNIFQTTQMYQVYKNAKNYEPLKLCVINQKNNRITGLVSGLIIREYDNFLARFSARSIIQGGPLITNDANADEIASILLRDYDSLVKKKVLFSQIRNLFETNSLFSNVKGYKREDHLNFLISLDQNEKDLWGQIHKDRRKNINRSANRGVTIEEVKDRSLLTIFYNLLQETYTTVKVPLADISLFESAFDILVPKDMAIFFLAKYQDKYIGARVVLTYKGIIYDWYAGAANDSLSLYPNEHLVWHILKWGREHGYKVFDFGGAGKPDVPYGPREFKRRFGGELVNYGWYEHVYAPLTTFAVMNTFKAYQKVKTLSGGKH